MPPDRFCPLVTVSRLVPSAAISAFSPAAEEDDRPSTATMAATPMVMPSAERAARSLRVRTPVPASRAMSLARSRRVCGRDAMVVIGFPPRRWP